LETIVQLLGQDAQSYSNREKANMSEHEVASPGDHPFLETIRALLRVLTALPAEIQQETRSWGIVGRVIAGPLASKYKLDREVIQRLQELLMSMQAACVAKRPYSSEELRRSSEELWRALAPLLRLRRDGALTPHGRHWVAIVKRIEWLGDHSLLNIVRALSSVLETLPEAIREETEIWGASSRDTYIGAQLVNKYEMDLWVIQRLHERLMIMEAACEAYSSEDLRRSSEEFWGEIGPLIRVRGDGALTPHGRGWVVLVRLIEELVLAQ